MLPPRRGPPLPHLEHRVTPMRPKLLSLTLTLPFAFAPGVWGQNSAPAGTEAPAETKQQGADARATAPGLKLGVVDFQRVAESYPRHKAMIKAWQEEGSRIGAEMQREREAIKTLEMERSAYDEGSSEWQDVQQRWAARMAALESQSKYEQRRLTLEKIKIQEQVYRDITRACGELATKLQLDLVLRVHNVDEGDDVPERLAQWDARTVIWHQPKHDITDQVIQLLLTEPYTESSASRSGNDGGAQDPSK